MRKTTPVLAVQMESGKTWEDPSEDFLYMLFEEVEEGESTWLIIERLTDSTGQTYFQSAKDGDGYVVEYRDGGPLRHFGAHVPDFRAAHGIASTWAFGLPGLTEAAEWQRVDFESR